MSTYVVKAGGKAVVVKRDEASIDGNRWSKYLVAGAAGTFAMLGPHAELDAEITTISVNSLLEDPVVDGYLQLFGPYTFGASGASFAFQQGFSETGAGQGQLAVVGVGNLQIAGFASGPYNYPSNLAYGANVSTQSFGVLAGNRGDMAWGSGYTNSQFVAPGTGYIGFQFDLGGGTQYGYAELNVFGVPDNRATFVQYSWGDVGDSISVGQVANAVPEPGALGILALGAVGVGAWRRRRQAS